ncbi:MAG: hypothetical protein PHP62_02740 [Candidatus Moranbacteria bacterium]|nr:hypothetical protein [Candidatus Moranbacteria bacterium]
MRNEDECCGRLNGCANTPGGTACKKQHANSSRCRNNCKAVDANGKAIKKKG